MKSKPKHNLYGILTTSHYNSKRNGRRNEKEKKIVAKVAAIPNALLDKFVWIR